MKRLRTIVSVILIACFSLVALVGADRPDDLLQADLPIAYGDAHFRQRILERTGGVRTPVGLVLSGGSARAFAHIGVLKYLEEQGIVVDYIISNSMGSIVGMLYAAGLSPDQILTAITNVSIQSLFDATLPLEGGIIDSARFISVVASILGPEIRLESLPIPIIVLAEDLVTKRQIQISEGNFYTVLRASYALPVYFPPVEYNGHLLIDGGVTNLVPVDLAVEYADAVIVSTTFYDIDTLNLKDPLTILNVSIDIGKRRQGVEELKRSMENVVWIRNEVEDVSFMEFGKSKYLAKKGYASAMAQEEQLRALPHSGIPSHLVELRAEFDRKLLESNSRYHLFNRVPMPFSSHILGLGVDVEYTTGDTTAFLDTSLVGVQYTWRTGNLKLSTIAGYSFDTISSSNFSGAPTLKVQADYYFYEFLKLAGYTEFQFDFPNKAPVLATGLKVDARLSLLDNSLNLGFVNMFDHLSNYRNSNDIFSEWKDHHWMYTLRLEGVLAAGDNQGGFNLGEQRLSFDFELLGDFVANRPFFSTRIQSELQQNSLDIVGTVKIFGRFALDGEGDVPFFVSDGMKTTNQQVRTQGHELGLAANPTNYLVGLNLGVGYRPKQFRPAIAELLLIEDSSIALYTDLLWYDTSRPPVVSVGAELHTSISLLGIRALPITIHGGWDLSTKAFMWGFYFDVVL